MADKAASLVHDWYPEPLPENVDIGTGSWLYSAFAFLHFRSERPHAVRIGKSCGVYNGSFFDLGPEGEVEIGDYSTLVGVIIATNGLARIGSFCFLAHEVLIADSFVAAPWRQRPGARKSAVRAGDISLGDDVWVGTGAVLLAGARVGNGAVIGAKAVVDFEVPPLAVVAGNPGAVVGFSGASRRHDRR